MITCAEKALHCSQKNKYLNLYFCFLFSLSLFSHIHTMTVSPYILTHKNQGLYCDIRQLVQFIKESHGNVFRRVALSALLDSAEKLNTTKKTDEKEETKPSSAKKYIHKYDIFIHMISMKTSMLSTLKHLFVNQIEQFQIFVMHKSNICMG